MKSVGGGYSKRDFKSKLVDSISNRLIEATRSKGKYTKHLTKSTCNIDFISFLQWNTQF